MQYLMEYQPRTDQVLHPLIPNGVHECDIDFSTGSNQQNCVDRNSTKAEKAIDKSYGK